MDKFHEKQKLPKMTQEGIQHLTRSITKKELAVVTKMVLTFLSASLEFRHLPHCRP